MRKTINTNLLDANGNYKKGSKTPKGRGNKAYIAQKLQRESQNKSLGEFFHFRSRAMKEFILKTKEGLVTMMGYDYKDAQRNYTDLILSTDRGRKVELVHV